jgi:hypothetical protein
MSFNGNTTGVTCGAGTANPDFTPVLRGVRVARSLVFCVLFCPVNSKLKIVAKQLICVIYVHELLHN